MRNGINIGVSDLMYLRKAESRSICPENPTGERGGGARCEWENGSAKNAARDLGKGWKVNPYEIIEPHTTHVVADISGEGCIQHIWMTPVGKWRNQILRIYWEGNENPSVECPLGDFFAQGWNEPCQINSLAVCANPGQAFNCYWPMPFKKRCLITIENISDEGYYIFYQIDYCLTKLDDEIAYFHAQFNRVNPLPYKQDYTILDGVKGKGHFVGTCMCWGVNNTGWWGEGEIKFFIDGDKEYPTICGTGTEDYFCGSYNFENKKIGQYQDFSTPYSGFSVIKPDGVYRSQQRFGLYRWHITDPIYFDKDIRITMQALGWREGNRYLPLQDDIASVAFWYQTLPHVPFKPLPSKDELEII